MNHLLLLQTRLRSLIESGANTAAPGLSQIALHDRLGDLEEGGQGLKQHIWSDGLTLSQKIEIEKLILRLASEQDLPPLSVNFLRRNPTTSGHTAPASIKSGSGALGITFDKKAIPGVRQVIVVASGKGGVGKSTVSANLAVALAAQNLRVGLMDCDVYGPSAPMLLGLRGEMTVGPGGKLIPMEAHRVKTVSFGFLTDVRSPVIWRGPMVAKAIEQLCYDVNWGDLDTLVIDMPPGTGDVQLTIAQKLPVHAAVVVTTPQDVALIDAHKAVSMFEKLDIPIAGVVENMAWHTCVKCGHQEHIFGEKAFEGFLNSRQLQLLSRIPLTSRVRAASDAGEPPALSAESGEAQPFVELANKIRNYLRL